MLTRYVLFTILCNLAFALEYSNDEFDNVASRVDKIRKRDLEKIESLRLSKKSIQERFAELDKENTASDDTIEDGGLFDRINAIGNNLWPHTGMPISSELADKLAKLQHRYSVDKKIDAQKRLDEVLYRSDNDDELNSQHGHNTDDL